MQEIIDTATDVGRFATELADAGVKTVIRYYNNRNGPNHPTKCLTARELAELQAAGLSIAIVFEQRAGAGGHLEDFSAASGARDGARALQLATALGQPPGSGIYFAVDDDFYRPSQLVPIQAYFTAASAALGGAYRCGVYGSGTVGDHLTRAGLVELVWLSGSVGWSGTRQALQAGRWTLFQKWMEQTAPFGRIDYDGNIFNAAAADFGEWSAAAALETPRGRGAAALYRVTARDGLNIRYGPGETFGVEKALPRSSLVRGLRQEGDWMQVDLEGDGDADGWMHAGHLEPVSGGLAPALAPASRPIDYALAELALDVQEIAGPTDNPRVVMYHQTTAGGAAHDEVAWCSSFVNYCVEKAGYVGTRSKWARSWHDGGWGHDATAAPAVGDIVVWRRQGGGDDGGHVGFFLSATATGIEVLGGNQSNRVRKQTYPRNGVLGAYQYDLLSIRRA